MVSIKMSELTPLSEESLARLKALSEKPDSEIDTSDIPQLPDSVWANAERGKFYRPVKALKSVRIDLDVIDWLQSEGKGYQTRLNAILRRAMYESIGQSHKG